MPNLNRRTMLKTATLSIAGAPFLNYAAPSLLAQSSIPALSPSVKANLATNLTDLVQNAGSQITPISAVDLACMVNWKEYVSQVPTNVGSAMSYLTGGLKTQALLDKLNLREAGPHARLARYPNQDMDCGWGGMAVAAGLVAGVVFFIPGGQAISAIFTLIAAIYAALEYLNVGC